MNDFSLLQEPHGRTPSLPTGSLSGLSVSFGDSGGKGTGKRAKKGRERRGTAASSPEKRRMPGAGMAGGGSRDAGRGAGAGRQMRGRDGRWGAGTADAGPGRQMGSRDGAGGATGRVSAGGGRQAAGGGQRAVGPTG